jgi:hypothetical protein
VGWELWCAFLCPLLPGLGKIEVIILLRYCELLAQLDELRLFLFWGETRCLYFYSEAVQCTAYFLLYLFVFLGYEGIL